MLRKEAGDEGDKPRPSALGRVALVLHNLVYWFFIIPFATPMSYRTGFAIYSGILLVRFAANTWINLRDFDWGQYYRYPLRIP